MAQAVITENNDDCIGGYKNLSPSSKNMTQAYGGVPTGNALRPVLDVVLYFTLHGAIIISKCAGVCVCVCVRACVCVCVCVCVCARARVYACCLLGADRCIPLTMPVDARQCCSLHMFVC